MIKSNKIYVNSKHNRIPAVRVYKEKQAQTAKTSSKIITPKNIRVS